MAPDHGRRSKFGVDLSSLGRLKRTYGDRTYASLAEARYARMLDLRLRAGDILDWKPQVRYPLHVSGVKVSVYVVDFEVINALGIIESHEVKGKDLPMGRLKRKMFEAEYGVQVKVIQAKDIR